MIDLIPFKLKGQVEGFDTEWYINWWSQSSCSNKRFIRNKNKCGWLNNCGGWKMDVLAERQLIHIALIFSAVWNQISHASQTVLCLCIAAHASCCWSYRFTREVGRCPPPNSIFKWKLPKSIFGLNPASNSTELGAVTWCAVNNSNVTATTKFK